MTSTRTSYNIMAAHFTQEDVLKIVHYKDNEKLTYKQIAEKMGRLDKEGLPNERAVMAQYTKYVKKLVPPKEGGIPVSVPTPAPVVPGMNDLNELTRKQRVEYLKGYLPSSERGKHIFKHVLSYDEQQLFLEEYYTVIREEDSLTSAEEQQLFNAILHLTLAWRAAAQDRECYNKSPISGYKGADCTVYIDTFKKDYQENMKKYNEFIKSLKLSREQRLKDMQRQGTTFLDFAEKYAKHDEQRVAIDEILKLEDLSTTELKRLQINGWLAAGGLPANNPPNFGTPKEAPHA